MSRSRGLIRDGLPRQVALSIRDGLRLVPWPRHATGIAHSHDRLGSALARHYAVAGAVHAVRRLPSRLCRGRMPAHARPTSQTDKPAQPPRARPRQQPKATKAAKTSAQAPKAARQDASAYAALPLAERIAIQFDLAWTGDYNGLINGEFSERTITAIKAFQTAAGQGDRRADAAGARALATAVEGGAGAGRLAPWSTTRSTGAQIGLPTKQVPQTRAGQRHALVLGAGAGADRDLPRSGSPARRSRRCSSSRRRSRRTASSRYNLLRRTSSSCPGCRA